MHFIDSIRKIPMFLVTVLSYIVCFRRFLHLVHHFYIG